jgi:hypothetical protein
MKEHFQFGSFEFGFPPAHASWTWWVTFDLGVCG